MMYNTTPHPAQDKSLIINKKDIYTYLIYLYEWKGNNKKY